MLTNLQTKTLLLHFTSSIILMLLYYSHLYQNSVTLINLRYTGILMIILSDGASVLYLNECHLHVQFQDHHSKQLFQCTLKLKC